MARKPDTIIDAGIIRPTPIRGLRRPSAARFFSISESLFQQLVDNGTLPPPLKIAGTTVSVWDLEALHEAFDRLRAADHGAGTKKNSWD
jgi:predicted DNA-binding transcriptional regulator AlpA